MHFRVAALLSSVWLVHASDKKQTLVFQQWNNSKLCQGAPILQHDIIVGKCVKDKKEDHSSSMHVVQGDVVKYTVWFESSDCTDVPSHTTTTKFTLGECMAYTFEPSWSKKYILRGDTELPAAPERPHLAQAWTALSKGDGLPGQVGLEHYIYEEKGDKYALQGHIWDYGASCKKIELNTPTGYIGKETNFAWGTYYINCDSVDCCYGGKPRGGKTTRPDVKQWDIHAPGPITSVEFKDIEDTTELNGNPVKSAEHWHETDKLPLSRGMNVSYHYYITRNSADILSHRIDFTAPSAQGSIVYGNFTVIHNVTGFRDTFKIPDMCYPQGSGKGHALSCGDAKVEEWEKKFFKHSYAMSRIATQNLVV